MDSSVLGVGAGIRDRAGWAIVGSLGIATVYTVVTVMAKETPALYVHQPWQDDPYDLLVSFDFVALPLLVAISVLRVQLCRRYAPLPVRRMADLLRAAGLAIGLSLATQVAEWVAVVRGAHRAAWNETTTGQVIVL